MIKENGQVFPVSHVPYTKEYEQLKKNFSPEGLEVLKKYITANLPENQFSVGTTFPIDSEHWGDGPLKPIYIGCGKHKEQAGYFLGQIVFDIILESDEQWFCTKTNITHRDFGTLFYFKRG